MNTRLSALFGSPQPTLVGRARIGGSKTDGPSAGNVVWPERRVVEYKPETPFDDIEGSHEYVALLAEALADARREVEAEIASAESDKADRRKQALLLVAFNLSKLNTHIAASRRILNDLRSLRRLLLAERGQPLEQDDETAAPHPM
jgi:hypothetical protein